MTFIYVLLVLLPPLPALRDIDVFLPLHTVMETFSVVVSCMIFGIIWNTCDANRPGNVIILGMSFLAAGLLDLAHLMSYHGMPDFITPASPQKAIVFWLAARLIIVVAMLMAATMVWKPLASKRKRYTLMILFLAYTVAVYWLGLWHPERLPTFWQTEYGLTPVKRTLEYIIMALYAVAALLFYWRPRCPGNDFNCDNLCWVASIIVISELCFTTYSTVTDAFNLLGHIYKIVAYLFLYHLLFIQLVRAPYFKLEQSRREVWLEKERAEITLQSIMDGVITTDAAGNVLSMNPVASQLTGWSNDAAHNQPLSQVFTVIDETDQSPIENPVEKCLRDKSAVLLSNHAMIVSSFGVAYSIEQLASPVIDKNGTIIGVVLVFRDVGERRQADNLLRASKAEIEDLYNHAPCGYHSLDKNGMIQRINQTELDWLGYSREEVVGTLYFTDLISADSAKIFHENYSRFMRDGKVNNLEYEFIRKDGSHFFVMLNATAIYDADGHYIASRSTLNDISERKKAEQALLKKEESLKKAQAIAHVGSWEWRIADGEQLWSDESFRIFGYAPGEIEASYDNFMALVLEKDRDSILKNMQAAFDNASPYYCEYRIKQPGGEIRHVLSQGEILFDPTGQPVQVIGTNLDITERKQAEHQLRKNEAEQRRQAEIQTSILDALPANLALINANGFIIAVNRRWQDFAEANGLSCDQVGIGANYLAVCHNIDGLDDDVMTTAKGLRGVLSGERDDYVIEYPCHAPDQQRWYRMQAVPLSTAERLGAVVIHLDITESWLYRHEIETLNQKLEQRVTERTHQLETANKELEAFSYSVSHDLRAPLRTIDGFAQILAADYGTTLENDARQHLDRILRAAKRMGELIDDLLQLSRVGRGELRWDAVNLSQMTHDILTDLKQREPERQARFKIAPDQYIQGDAHLLKIVLENLLTNAWKFTRTREISEIEFGVQQKDEETIYFFRDNGVGFNPKYGHKLFGAFQRLHSEEEFEGTGIGLATVQRIMSRHGGNVWAESIPDQGATFFFQNSKRIEITA